MDRKINNNNFFMEYDSDDDNFTSVSEQAQRGKALVVQANKIEKITKLSTLAQCFDNEFGKFITFLRS